MVVKNVEEELVNAGAVCAKCGGAVQVGGHENRVMCTGCNMPTDNCSCSD